MKAQIYLSFFKYNYEKNDLFIRILLFYAGVFSGKSG